MPQIRRNPSSAATLATARSGPQNQTLAEPPPPTGTMTYQALARKWRPQDFSSLIGQEPVVTALRNALTEDRVAQAYLFAGIRGVGKTTAARVLAKALNCERGPAADPCNECRACTQITSGADLDVLEVDAATYSKVEQVRELTESLRYGPAHNRYKVVVLDEVHRLSRQAFDALLKIVEEPPPHLVFIFATTEIEAVPATILSRCQEFHFRRVPAAILTDHLETLARAERITISSAGLRLIARAGDGSVRDAVALLDQLATYGAGTIDDESASRLLAGFDPALFHRLLSATLTGDGSAIQRAVREIDEEGRDPRQIFAGLLAYGRDALHLSLGSPVDSLELPGEEAVRLKELVDDAGYENLLRWTHHLLQSENLVRRSEASGLALEIALLRAAELPKVTRVEELLGGPPGRGPVLGPGSGAPTTSAAEPTRDSSPSAPRPSVVSPPAAPAPTPTDPSRAPELPVSPPHETTPSDRSSSQVQTTSGGQASIEDLLSVVSRDRQVLAAHLRQAQRLEVEDGRLVVYHDPGDDWLGPALQRAGNRTTLDSALAEVYGPGTTWTLRDGQPAVEGEEEDGEIEEPPELDATVQSVLQIFDGTVDRTVPSS